MLLSSINHIKSYQDQRRRYRYTLMGLALLAILSTYVSFLFGGFQIDWSALWKIGSLDNQVFLQLRLPRILATLLVGASLSIAGVIMQGLFRNPLADPSLLGMTSGASLFAAFFMLFANQFTNSVFVIFWGLPISAFLGSLFVTNLIYILSVRQGQANLAILLLAGIAINALSGALIGILTFVADDNELRSLTFWTMGSFATTEWLSLLTCLPLILWCLFLLEGIGSFLNSLALGETGSKTLGICVIRQKRKAIVIIALLVAMATAIAGPIAFIGLVVPHIMRLAIGAEHRMLLLHSAISGGILLTLSDTIARTVLAPAEIPIGLITVLIGAPYFIYLLIQKSTRGRLL